MKEMTILTEQWKAMPRNNAAELTAADRYFDSVLMPLARERFAAEYQRAEQPEYYGGIFTMGTSWQPMALTLTAIPVKESCFICTEQTRPQLTKLAEFMGTAETEYDCRMVQRSDVKTIYEIVVEKHQQWRGYGKSFIDITGGTKAMASGAAMIGAVLGMDIYYVESTYLPLYRRPLPGSERLELLENPLEQYAALR